MLHPHIPPQLRGEIAEVGPSTPHGWNTWVIDPRSWRPYRRVISASTTARFVWRYATDARGELVASPCGGWLTVRQDDVDLVIWRGPYLPSRAQVDQARRELANRQETA